MPKETAVFRSVIDYQEAVMGKAKGPVLFGHPEDLAVFREDIKRKDIASLYFGMVLYPERESRKA